MSHHILVVDDEPDLEVLIRQKFRKHIKENTYRFSFAANGEEAWDKLQPGGIDLVLTDINMPRMDGLTLLSRLMENNALLKTVVISAYGDMKNIRTAMNRGAFDFLTKPIDFQDLEITLTRGLEQVGLMRRMSDQQKELQAAWTIQKSILPKVLPSIKGLSISAHYLPMNNIGGDMYDFSRPGPEELGVFIADVSGHGVPAALIASMLKVAFTILHQYSREPARLLEEMNRLMRDKLHNAFFTASYAYINMKEYTLTAARAGHPSLLIHRRQDNSILTVHPKGKLMGWFDELGCENETINLLPQDRLLFYTDGIIEAENDSKQFFGDEELASFILSHQQNSTGDFADSLIQAVKLYDNNIDYTDDDITLLVMDVSEQE